jgi:hypothetical protein
MVRETGISDVLYREWAHMSILLFAPADTPGFMHAWFFSIYYLPAIRAPEIM